MKKALCHFLLVKILGWKIRVTVPDYKKCIIVVAPHTSNWDFILGEIFYSAIGRKTNLLMKKEWFFFPINIILRSIGVIPVDRGHSSSLTSQLIKHAKNQSEFHLAITPEGTRSANSKWKRGFYHIAMGAQIPIVLYAIDFPSKTIVGEKVIIPTGDADKEIEDIKKYYTHFVGKNPENFKITG
jgi:1-acyl-sn-glycerol-3-phosphate acyltransferase